MLQEIITRLVKNRQSCFDSSIKCLKPTNIARVGNQIFIPDNEKKLPYLKWISIWIFFNKVFKQTQNFNKLWTSRSAWPAETWAECCWGRTRADTCCSVSFPLFPLSCARTQGETSSVWTSTWKKNAYF